MLPMVAIAVLACVMGYYIKNKFFKDDEEKDEKQKNEEKKTRDMKFPTQTKAHKPWLTNGVQPAGQPRPSPIGPTGGYEFHGTLPGYHQAVNSKPKPSHGGHSQPAGRGHVSEKRTTSQQSGKSGSSGYQSHSTGVQHISEKGRSNYSRHVSMTHNYDLSFMTHLITLFDRIKRVPEHVKVDQH